MEVGLGGLSYGHHVTVVQCSERGPCPSRRSVRRPSCEDAVRSPWKRGAGGGAGIPVPLSLCLPHAVVSLFTGGSHTRGGRT